MARRRGVLSESGALLMLGLALSGCAGDGDDGGSPPGDGPDGAMPDPFAEPANWTLGQWWRFSVTSTFEDASTEPTTLIVTNQTAEDYVLDTTSRDQAGFDAEEDISYVGPIRKSDLAGQQGDNRVQYFQFPLTNNSSWGTTWDGAQRTIMALGPIGDEEFALEAYEADALRVRYSYHARTGFFGYLEFYDGNSTTPGFAIRSQDFGTNYTGTYVRAEIPGSIRASSNTDPGTGSGALAVANGTQELNIRMTFECSSGMGHITASVLPQDPAATMQRWSHNEACTGAVSVNETIEEPAMGTWRYDGLYQGGGEHVMRIFTRNFLQLQFP